MHLSHRRWPGPLVILPSSLAFHQSVQSTTLEATRSALRSERSQPLVPIDYPCCSILREGMPGRSIATLQFSFLFSLPPRARALHREMPRCFCLAVFAVFRMGCANQSSHTDLNYYHWKTRLRDTRLTSLTSILRNPRDQPCASLLARPGPQSRLEFWT